MQDVARLNERRKLITATWDLTEGVVLVPSGLAIPVAGTDQFHEYHAHPEFQYLTGTQAAGAVAGFDRHDGWVLFAPVASLEDRVWVGDGDDPERLADTAGVPVRPLAELGAWLEARRGDPLALLGNPDLARNPTGYGIENWAALELEIDRGLAARLSEQVAETRRVKDIGEITLMRAAAEASGRGHDLAMRSARPGMTERQLQIEVEAEFFRAGSARTAYGSIVGTGSNGSVLHFSPTHRELKAGELVLMDAGADYGGYASDVTRTFPVSQQFEGVQRDLYELVLAVQQDAIDGVRPGVEYKDLHMRAAGRIAAGLVELGILLGEPSTLVERDAHALFFPHGLGHMLGLSTHDAGGCLAGREPSSRFGLKWLRADLPLAPGYVVTIEPGIYFIRALLTDPERRAQFADAVNWDRVDGLLDFGGIRIEDDVLVTESGSDVLSGSIPKTVGAIEELRREALAQ